MYKFGTHQLNCDVVVDDLSNLSRQDWLQLRRQSLGGSDISAALGLNRWRSPYEVYLDKIGQPLPKETSEACRLGIILEEPIRQELAYRTGWRIEKPAAIFRHRDISYLTANLDGLSLVPGRGPAVIEIKTTSGFKGSEWENDQLPPEYMLQVQTYLSIMDLNFGLVGCLIGGQKLVTVEVQRDEVMIRQIHQLAAAFWEHVTHRVPPPVDGTEACAELLAKLYPASIADPVMILPSEVDDWLPEYWVARAEEEQAVERRRLIENRIKEILGERETGITPAGKKISWKAVSSSRIDVTALKTAEPALYEKFRQTSTSRRLQVAS